MPSTCRSCGAPVVWVTMADTGRRMPLDEALVDVVISDWVIPGARSETVVVGSLLSARAVPAWSGVPADVEIHATARRVRGRRSHFSTCPNADQHRKPRRFDGRPTP